jgi:hypothetical protein
MALASDMDWVIILAVGAFLLFGTKGAGTMRTIGRWYGRAMRMKQQMLGEFTKAAEISLPSPGQPLSIRNALLGIEPLPSHTGGVPVAVSTAPSAPYRPTLEPSLPWTGSYPVPTWSMAIPSVVIEPERTP